MRKHFANSNLYDIFLPSSLFPKTGQGIVFRHICFFFFSFQSGHSAWNSGKPGIVREIQSTLKIHGFFFRKSENLKPFNAIFFHQKYKK